MNLKLIILFTISFSAFLITFSAPPVNAANACRCSGAFTGALVGETTCGIAISKGVNCQWNSAKKSCDCSGLIPAITDEGKCNSDGVIEAYSLSLIPGVNYNASCVWTEDTKIQNQNKTKDNMTIKLLNPLCGGKDCNIPSLIGQIIKGLMGILGSVTLAMFLYGGFLWLTAAGRDAQVTKGRETLIWAALGLVLIFSSYALISFLIKTLTNK